MVISVMICNSSLNILRIRQSVQILNMDDDAYWKMSNNAKSSINDVFNHEELVFWHVSYYILIELRLNIRSRYMYNT